MIVNPPRVLNLRQLHDELIAAGVAVGALGASGVPFSEVHTYDASGSPRDLPAAAAAVLAAHVPQPEEADAAAADVRTNVQTEMARLDQIIGASSPTTAQLVAAVQDEARAIKRLYRLVADRLA